MHGEMFRGCDGLEVMGIVPLHTVDECEGHLSGEIRVLSVGLLAAAPTRIAKDIDIRRPKSEPVVASVIIVTTRIVIFGTGFGRYNVGDPVFKIRVPGRG